MNFAPIVIFCYRRKIDTLVDSLLQNPEAKDSELYIFSDGFKSENDREDVLNVRKSLDSISGFKSINIINAEQNNGLANSIIRGVSTVIDKNGRVIVLEDDLIVSKHFLSFMNNALEFYRDRPDIWSISGYCPPIKCLDSYEKDVFMSVRSSSWGWATWANRWEKVDWSLSDYDALKKDKDRIKKFERGGNDMFKMLELQKIGKIDSWAIRWCYSQFNDSSYSVLPKISMVQNIGFSDGIGTHNSGDDSRWKAQLATIPVKYFDVEPSKDMIKCFKQHHDLSLYTKIGYILKKWGGYKLVKRLLQ